MKHKGKALGSKSWLYYFGKMIINLLIYIIAISYIFPFFWMLYTSFKSRAEYTMSMFALPKEWTFHNYINAFMPEIGFFRAFYNSVFNTLISVIFIILLSFMVGYLLSRYKFKGQNLLFSFFMVSIFIPSHALLVPVYIQFRALGMLGTKFVLLFPYITLALPIAIFLYSKYIETIPRSIDEAAHMDGAGMFSIIYRIMFPVCMPMTGTLIILNVMGVWNEFSFALVLASMEKARTLPLWLTVFDSQYSSNITLKVTGIMVCCLPVILVYMFFSDKIMEGIATGAIKG